ncbi:hypothetical protein OHA98_41785 [Streptomyces sp. NBC_00654]|uniref:hypothetical protein n=1 Tax=Streptomyces sp. NBC_00654 TaxID=2975799 RepID=UPI0022568107|nr:hypothetical protein [Streptomyces sp. NBC_00654]MCX4969360.1 hypothetical protein [Streptomyces sp. NBC_00654]MCX4971139.1 hypothetical protein [Streptomyces sp. NBC_00654]
MIPLPNARRAAAECLREYDLDGLPEWRLAADDDTGRTEPRCIAPVCPDPEHERVDASVYSCCPGPVVEVGDRVLAEYLVALLNDDRGAGEQS